MGNNITYISYYLCKVSRSRKIDLIQSDHSFEQNRNTSGSNFKYLTNVSDICSRAQYFVRTFVEKQVNASCEYVDILCGMQKDFKIPF